jgi:hypothetical protein
VFYVLVTGQGADRDRILNVSLKRRVADLFKMFQIWLLALLLGTMWSYIVRGEDGCSEPSRRRCLLSIYKTLLPKGLLRH